MFSEKINNIWKKIKESKIITIIFIFIFIYAIYILLKSSASNFLLDFSLNPILYFLIFSLLFVVFNHIKEELKGIKEENPFYKLRNSITSLRQKPLFKKSIKIHLSLLSNEVY